MREPHLIRPETSPTDFWEAMSSEVIDTPDAGP
jgi:hypothetical protein